MLRWEGSGPNHKRVHRIYCQLALQLRPRPKRGVRYVRGNEMPIVTAPNERWSIDFVPDRLSTSRAFRVLTASSTFHAGPAHLKLTSRSPASVASTFERIALSRSLLPTLKPDNDAIMERGVVNQSIK